ncbi:hypothetical protein [Methylophaga sp. OBS3]|uniref:hypothetical protein n=1 Tax=Methylophaga sp. OBS3 TaxID=2991934 RepID=UPI002256ECF6|nr:hypothetical protein [Methylophaga sp. OBS3]MCX4189657.1 hypothetical protein [Methylophaga sp. OBS3]
MNFVTKSLMVMVLSLPLLSACASRSQENYYADEVGSVMAIEDVWVVSSRLVKIEGLGKDRRPGWGAAVGATVAGATAYGITEADNPAGVAITIIALIGGAIAGQFVDEKANSELGAEYILSKENGDKIAIVQAIENKKDMLPPKTAGVLIRGNDGYVRVVPQ